MKARSVSAARSFREILDGRIYGAQSDFGGVWKNDYPGASGNSAYFGAHRWSNYSGALKFTPTSRLTITGLYYNSYRWQQMQPFYTINGTSADGNSLNCGLPIAPGQYSLYCGTLPTSNAFLHTGQSGLFFQPQPGTWSKTQLWKGSVQYKISDDLTLNYIYGNVYGASLEQANFTSNSSILPNSGVFFGTAQREGGTLGYGSHEVRLVYNNPSFPLQGEVGYFHSQASDHLIFGLLFLDPSAPYKSETNNPTDISGVAIPFDNQDTIYTTNSPFGRLTYNFLDNKAQLSAEFRYTETGISDDDILAHETSPDLPLLKSSYGDFTPRFTAQYKFTPNNMVYASAASGAKAGGFNGYVSGSYTLQPSQQSYGEETNWTYELGWKAEMFDHTLDFDADVFYVDWKNRQEAVEPAGYVEVHSQSAGVVPTIYENVGDASSYGLEVSAQWLPTEHLTFTGSLSLQNPRYGSNAVAESFDNVCDNIICSEVRQHRRQGDRPGRAGDRRLRRRLSRHFLERHPLFHRRRRELHRRGVRGRRGFGQVRPVLADQPSWADLPRLVERRSVGQERVQREISGRILRDPQHLSVQRQLRRGPDVRHHPGCQLLRRLRQGRSSRGDRPSPSRIGADREACR